MFQLFFFARYTKIYQDVSTVCLFFLEDTPRCLLFMYSMYGKDVGAFNIYREGQGVAKTAVFKKSGDKGQDWEFGEVTIQPATDLKVTIV